MDPSALFSTPEPAECYSPRDLETPAPEDETADSSDKKPTKKRKSWGQVLPEPKTNLPPRYDPPTGQRGCHSPSTNGLQEAGQD